MKKAAILFFLFAVIIFSSFKIRNILSVKQNGDDTLRYADEKHFKNIRQLTFGGDNAEAYWSYDGKYIIFQHKNEKEGVMCDQMYIGKIPLSINDSFTCRMVSSGKGRCTCGYFLPDGKHIIYASTFLGGDSCPPVPDRSKYGNKYIWPVYESYEIFLADTSGKIIKQLTHLKRLRCRSHTVSRRKYNAVHFASQWRS